MKYIITFTTKGTYNQKAYQFWYAAGGAALEYLRPMENLSKKAYNQ
jgi:hypothetical protein